MPDEKLNELYKRSSESKELVEGWQNKVGEYEYAVVYRLDGVEVVKAAKITTETLKGVLEIRAFDENGELHAVKRTDGNWAGRVRTDKLAATEEDAVPVLDELHVLWGTEIRKDGDDALLLKEDRGTQVKIPQSVFPSESDGVLPKGKRLALLVRNYLNADDSFAFDDYRFVEFRIVSEGR